MSHSLICKYSYSSTFNNRKRFTFSLLLRFRLGLGLASRFPIFLQPILKSGNAQFVLFAILSLRLLALSPRLNHWKNILPVILLIFFSCAKNTVSKFLRQDGVDRMDTPDMLKRLNEIEKMDIEDRGSILKVLDGFIKSVKLKNIAAL